MRYSILALVLVLTVGCGSYKSIELDDKWAPLEQIHERPDMLGSATTATTIGHTVYVESINRWLADHPIDSPRFNATMLHEQLHSVRQLDTGVTAWIARYATDIDFMWAEEQLGWYLTLRELKRTGNQINVLGVATTLHGYKNLLGHMVGTAEAITWVEDVLAGRWTPPN